jgi:hypothetical protein
MNHPISVRTLHHLAFASAFAAVCFLAGCDRKSTSDSSDDEYDPDAELVGGAAEVARTVGPAYILDDAIVARVAAALRDLRTQAAKDLAEKSRDGSLLAIGPGITFAVQNGPRIVQLHGFESAEDFEQALRHVQIAFGVVLATETYGEFHRDFDGGGRRKNMADQADALRRARRDAETDQVLSLEARRSRVAEIDEKLRFLDGQIAELDDIAGAFGSDRESVPPENVAVVRRARDHLVALLTPLAR